MTDASQNVVKIVVIFELICNFVVLLDLKFLETYIPTLIYEKKKKNSDHLVVSQRHCIVQISCGTNPCSKQPVIFDKYSGILEKFSSIWDKYSHIRDKYSCIWEQIQSLLGGKYSNQ